MTTRNVTQKGIDLIKSFEGIVDGDKTTPNYDPYLDPVGIWTIGYGHALSEKGKFLIGKADEARAKAMFNGGITTKQADELLAVDLAGYCRDVQRLVTVQLTDNQFDALLSFAFNVGVSSLKESTLLKRLNSHDYAGAAQEFLKWDKATVKGRKVTLPGLTRRRKAESELFTLP